MKLWEQTYKLCHIKITISDSSVRLDIWRLGVRIPFRFEFFQINVINVNMFSNNLEQHFKIPRYVREEWRPYEESLSSKSVLEITDGRFHQS